MRMAAGLLAICCAAWACAGGVDSGGTGAPTSSYARGRLSGFGSIVLNGVHFDETRALVLDDEGGLHYRGDLKLGMSLDVQAGEITTDAATGVSSAKAQKVVFASAIRGPLERIDIKASTITVLGQTVAVGPSTAFDPDAVMAGLRRGLVLEVHALLDEATGRYDATRIDVAAQAPSYKLRGIVSGLDEARRTFSIGNARISYAALDDAELPPLFDGALLKLSVRTAAGKGGTWELLHATAGTRAIPDTPSAEVDGLVSAYHGIERFKLNGMPVNAAGAAVLFTGGTSGQLRNGVRVLVTGQVIDGVLVAGSVEYRAPGEDAKVTLEGAVQSVDAATHSFVLRGNTVVFDPGTSFRSGSPSMLVPGAAVKVSGSLADGGTKVRADKIKFDR
ncbi:hypothetical protein DZC73_21075 [Albitalea terrae]|uniref:DUF5666 domain-containing protein n=2 Tax=Piscinibacter terrae TaxID=2496871 RepID=A0A3N7JNU0_9BURK|nr:hypothetical protein DZC73_21075 [Albitalea terrae]